MSNYKPPYTITSKILDLTSKIAESMSELKHSSNQNLTLMLRKKNRIKTLAGTLEIEGNFLGEEKITALLDGKRVLGTIPEIAEVEGAIRAYQELENYSYDDINDLLNAHKILMSEILTTAGSFRSSNVRVGEHIAPQAHFVPELMTQLFDWLNESDEHMLLKSCIFHYEFEFIHPFSDGNGRMGRLWQSVMLHNYNPLFSSLPTESIVRDHQQEYYKALEDATELGESTPFIEFMLKMILEAIVKVGKEVGNKVGNLTENQMMIVEMMKVNSKVSAKLLAEEVGISVRKIEENVAKLKKLGIIERVGGTRGHWEVKEKND
ncbi:Fic family protein [Sulfurimonas sp. NW9]|uniref:Fic family protein n=1 Tax=Sulfurimonas sp. NW9 TaxID=2922728 RepID=UPI003DA97876